MIFIVENVIIITKLKRDLKSLIFPPTKNNPCYHFTGIFLVFLCVYDNDCLLSFFPLIFFYFELCTL